MASGLPIASEKKPPSTAKHAQKIKNRHELEKKSRRIGENVDKKVSSPREAKIQRPKGFFKGVTVEMKLNLFSSNIN